MQRRESAKTTFILADRAVENTFNVNDTVFYPKGYLGIKECSVVKVMQAVTQDEPFYKISWGNGGACVFEYVFEHEIFAAKKELDNSKYEF